MLPRTLETEVMDTLAEAVDYDSMDHSAVNRLFADDFLAFLASEQKTGASPSARPLKILDVGTGTALIPIELCGRGIAALVTGVDLASHMLQLGLRNIIRAGMQQQIKLDHVDAKQLPYADGAFDALISNSIIHHIPQPADAFKEMMRVTRPGGLLFVRDLLRPADAETVSVLVDMYAAGANDHQRQMFRDSLHAALTLDEIRQLLADLGCSPAWVTQTSDRHWTIAGQRCCF